MRGSSRRDFLRAAGASLAAAGLGGCRTAPRVGKPRRGAGERLNVALIGVAGRGAAHLAAALAAGERIVALCDVDEASLLAAREKVAGRCPDVRLYKDFRVLFDAEREIDAAVIATPDHGHGIQAAWAIRRGCHVYLETPAVRTLAEFRALRELARERGVVVQLGEAGSATEEYRRAAEILRSGLIGAVSEVHAWTNRPVWPQGLRRPEGSDPVPPALDWDLWLGGAPARPFKSKVYHRFNWRAWTDFGTGALGDAGTQAMSLAFRVLGLGAPVKALGAGHAECPEESYPKSSQVCFTFAAAGRRQPAVTLQWYDGLARPPAELMPQVVAGCGFVPSAGCLLVGERGVWVSTDDTGRRHSVALCGEARVTNFEKHEACLALGVSPQPERGLLPEFFDAVRGDGTACCGLDEMTALTECVLTGCVAQRVPGALTWESRKGCFRKNEAANRLAVPVFRDGWDYLA